MDKHLEQIPVWIIRLVWLSFMLPMRLQTVLLIGCGALAFLYGLKQRTYPRDLGAYALPLLLGLLFLLYPLALFLTPAADRDIVQGLIERKLSLLLLPVAFLPLQGWRREWHWFVAVQVIRLGGAMALTLLQVRQISNHVGFRLRFEEWAGIHPSYAGLYAVLGLIILRFGGVPWSRWAKVIAYGLLLAVLLLLSPKTMVLAALVVMLWPASVRSGKALLTRSGLVLGTLALAYAVLPFFRQRGAEVWQFLTGTTASGQTNSMAFRELIWRIDWNLLQEHWLMGLGPARLQRELDAAFLQASILSGSPVGTYNTHCEYINQWLSFGLPGLLLFLSFWLLLYRSIWKARDTAGGLLVFALALACLTENILSRQHGVLAVAVFAVVLLQRGIRGSFRGKRPKEM